MVVGEDVGLSVISDEDWIRDLPPSQPVELECILDKKELNKTRRKVVGEDLMERDTNGGCHLDY